MIEDTYKITTVEMISAFPPGVAYSPADINCCLFLIYGLYLAKTGERLLDEHPVYAVDHPVFPYVYKLVRRKTPILTKCIDSFAYSDQTLRSIVNYVFGVFTISPRKLRKYVKGLQKKLGYKRSRLGEYLSDEEIRVEFLRSVCYIIYVS